MNLIRLSINLVKVLLLTLMSFNTIAESDQGQTLDVTRYGPFGLFKAMPNVLFFYEDIEPGQIMYLRKAIRNETIDTIVISSNGGNVREGLIMAGVIFDKEINTLVLKESDCMSACSFMFFAGKNRVSNGRLGIHQFYSPTGKDKEEVGKVQQSVQFTTSEIVGYLNEFGTPPFIYEKMFSEIDMYFLDNRDKERVEKTNKTYEKQISAIYSFLDNVDEMSNKSRRKTEESSKKPVDSVDLERDNSISENEKLVQLQIKMQIEMTRLGCYDGLIDGVINDQSIEAFKKLSNLEPSMSLHKGDSFEQLIDYVASLPTGLCKGANTTSTGYDYATVKQMEMKLKRNNCLSGPVDGEFSYNDLFDLYRYELLNHGSIRFDKTPSETFMNKVINEQSNSCLMLGQVANEEEGITLTNKELHDELARLSCVIHEDKNTFVDVDGARLLAEKLHDIFDLRRLPSRSLGDLAKSSPIGLCNMQVTTAKQNRDRVKSQSKSPQVTNHKKNLEGMWSMVAHCSSGKVTGRVILENPEISKGAHVYSLAYSNDLGMNGEGTLTDSPSGSVKFNVNWKHNRSYPQLNGSGSFVDQNKSQLVGNSSDGCSFVVSRN